MLDNTFTKMIYSNPLYSENDIEGFRLEGEAKITFSNGRMRLENAIDPDLGQKSNFVYWCPEDFPSDFMATWDFWPIREPGLCMFFFSAKGMNGENIFDSSLRGRTGEYAHYFNGDINTLHASYFRRRYEDERAFHTCNLRKSYGCHMVCQGADPIPDVKDTNPPYGIRLIKNGPVVEFYINDLSIYRWIDDGVSYGPVLGGGKMGFRQMAPMIGEYANFKVYTNADEG